MQRCPADLESPGDPRRPGVVVLQVFAELAFGGDAGEVRTGWSADTRSSSEQKTIKLSGCSSSPRIIDPLYLHLQGKD
jgi:hypothetical protein